MSNKKPKICMVGSDAKGSAPFNIGKDMGDYELVTAETLQTVPQGICSHDVIALYNPRAVQDLRDTVNALSNEDYMSGSLLNSRPSLLVMTYQDDIKARAQENGIPAIGMSSFVDFQKAVDDIMSTKISPEEYPGFDI